MVLILRSLMAVVLCGTAHAHDSITMPVQLGADPDPKAAERSRTKEAKAWAKEEAKTSKLCSRAIKDSDSFLRKVALKGQDTPDLDRIAGAIASGQYGCNDPAVEARLFEMLLGPGDGLGGGAIAPYNVIYLRRLMEIYGAGSYGESTNDADRVVQLRERLWVSGDWLSASEDIAPSRKRELMLIPANWDRSADDVFNSDRRAVKSELLLDPASPRFNAVLGEQLHKTARTSRATMLLALHYTNGEHLPMDQMKALRLMREAATIADTQTAAEARQWLQSPQFAGIGIPDEAAPTTLFARGAVGNTVHQSTVEQAIRSAEAEGKLVSLNAIPTELQQYQRPMFVIDHDYPSRSIAKEEFGKVKLWAIFGPDGRFVAVEAKGTSDHLRQASARAAMRRAFASKAVLNGYAGHYVRIALPSVDFWLMSREAAEAAAIVPQDEIAVFANPISPPDFDVKIVHSTN